MSKTTLYHFSSHLNIRHQAFQMNKLGTKSLELINAVKVTARCFASKKDSNANANSEPTNMAKEQNPNLAISEKDLKPYLQFKKINYEDGWLFTKVASACSSKGSLFVNNENGRRKLHSL